MKPLIVQYEIETIDAESMGLAQVVWRREPIEGGQPLRRFNKVAGVFGYTVLSADAFRHIVSYPARVFELGSGPGAAMLALAIVADFLEDDGKARLLHQQFKWAFVDSWRGDSNAVTGREIVAWLDRQTQADAQRDQDPERFQVL